MTWLEADTRAPHAPGERLRALLARPGILRVPGAHHALAALLARRAGFEALYVSGAALTASMGLPDLGVMTLEELAFFTRTIFRAVDLPLIVDADTGHGEALNVMRTVRELEAAGAAAIQLEDQELPKKCGHLSDKRLVPAEAMAAKIEAARRARSHVLIVARTDAAAEGLDQAIARARLYVEAGADVIFPEALTDAAMFQTVAEAVPVPVLANMTEFGRTPQLTARQFETLGCRIVIWPVSSLRVAARAIEQLYRTGRRGHHGRRPRSHADPRRAVRPPRLPRVRGPRPLDRQQPAARAARVVRVTGPPPPMAGWLAPNKGGRPLAPLLALALATIAPAADADTETASYVGSQACAPCHAEAFTAWSGSDHAWAMRPASDATVKGDFGDVTVEHLGSRARFFRRDGRFWVETDGADGAPAEFEVTYTFGITPLQQYLVALDGGRLQALPFAWDTRPAAAGGQRWFHLHPDEFIGAADPLHWTGLFYNWNASCAACHATDLVEGYDLASNRFATSWAELDVGCEACHGPGSAHLAWAESAPAGAAPTGSLGLTTRLAESAEGHWAFEGDDPIASWQGPPRPGAEIEVCAPCHARRRPLVEGPQPGTPFLDAYAPALLEERLYHPDGQILDEVYVWGSFVQSRMHRAGVTCSDCHQPHDLTLHAPGNAVCGQCHRPDVFDDPAHHHHEAGTAGAQCVECHMPATTYMVVDPRRDHGFRVPRPDLSVRLGVPNPCTGCHTDRTDAWAAAAIEDWYGAERPRPPGFAVALDAARKGLPEAAALLAEVATDPDQPAIARATALSHLPDHLGPDVLGAYQAGLDDPDPLVRAAAVRALAPFPPEQRLAAAGPLLDDPVRLVRVEAGRLLAAVPPERVPAALRDPLARAIEEYVASQRAVAERPEAHLNLGVLAAEQGRLDGAEQELRQALALDPAFVPAHVNLADLYRARGREDLAEGQLREAIRDDPEAAAAHYALGLLLVRTGRRGAAVEELGRAAALDPDAARYAYAHALALHGEGRTDAALEVLEAAHERHPADREILFALVTINRDRGAPSRARLFLRRLMDLAPDDPGVRQLARGLGIAP